jgi:hypothetical protein
VRKILISDYKVIQDGKELPYPMREALAEVLFHPDLKLRALDLLKRDDLARKILNQSESHILLEDSEYSLIKSAVDVVQGFTRNDVEFVRRVLNAESVEVMEK